MYLIQAILVYILVLLYLYVQSGTQFHIATNDKLDDRYKVYWVYAVFLLPLMGYLAYWANELRLNRNKDISDKLEGQISDI